METLLFIAIWVLALVLLGTVPGWPLLAFVLSPFVAMAMWWVGRPVLALVFKLATRR